MGLLQKLKSALGLDGAQSPDPGTAAPGDVNVTVEREPASESEDAVKGTETASSEAGESAEPDQTERTPAESSDSAVPEADEPDVEDSTGAETTDASEEETAVSTEEAAAVSDDPVTEINGIGPAYGQRLSEAGIETVGDLAAADAGELEVATDISANRIQGWVDAAAEY